MNISMRGLENQAKNDGFNSDEAMALALQRLKEEQAQAKLNISKEWSAYEESLQGAQSKKQERLEREADPSSTSQFANPNSVAFSSGAVLEQKHKDFEKFGNTLGREDSRNSIEEELLTESLTPNRDEKHIAMLENELGIINTSFEANPSQSPESLHTPLDSYRLAQANIELQAQQRPPEEQTLAKLTEMGIDYKELIAQFPRFASMSEGQKAYILHKTQEQGVEHIEENARIALEEKKKNAGFFKKIWKGGAMRRASLQESLNNFTGLSAFGGDLEQILSRVDEAGFEIDIEDNGSYTIQYAKISDTQTEEQKKARLNFNRYATQLSDIPYEWKISKTRSRKEEISVKTSQKNFEKAQNVLISQLKQEGLSDEQILSEINKLNASIELNQLFSSYGDVSQTISKLEKNTSFLQEKTTQIFGATGAVMAIGAGTRLLSKSLWGLGGAVGASSVLGGIMAWRRKSEEFKNDAKLARRGVEGKKTTDKVLNAAQSTEKIQKLVERIGEAEGNPEKQKKLLIMLETRLIATDERMKAGRVNFGSAKEQLRNKSALVNAMAFATVYKNELAQETENVFIPKRAWEILQERDRNTKSRRTKDRASAMLIGSTIGAVSSTTAFLLTDYFQGGESLEKLKQVLQNAGEDIKESFNNKVQNTYEGIKNLSENIQSVKEGFMSAVQNIQEGLNSEAVPSVENSFNETLPPPPPPQNEAVSSGAYGEFPDSPVIPPTISPTDGQDPLNISNSSQARFGGKINPENISFNTSVEASSKGAIATFENLQSELRIKYPDTSLAPEHIKEFLAKTPTQLAIQEGFYVPNGEVNESAKIFKGGKLGFDTNGKLVYVDARSGVSDLSGDGKFGGEFFDSAKSESGTGVNRELANRITSTDAWKKTLDQVYAEEYAKPGNGAGVSPNGVRILDRAFAPGERLVSESISASSVSGETSVASVASAPVSVETSVNSIETPGVYKNLAIDPKNSLSFEIGESKLGKPLIKFTDPNFNWDNLNAYHKAYLNQSIESFAVDIAQNSSFLRENPGMDSAGITKELQTLTNQMIARDQILQKGGLDPQSQEYKLLTQERDLLRNRIKTRFESYLPNKQLVGNFDGQKFADPLYSANIGVKNPILPFESISIPDSETISNYKLDVSRNADGVIQQVDIKPGARINLSKTSLQEFGYQENWFENEKIKSLPDDTKNAIKGSVLDIKKLTTYRNALPNDSDVYKYFDTAIKQKISILSKEYPSIFN